ncbi:hypothetical protein OG21DRAFT_1502637 [Imleria badia]|nr:hypothetical protein OG21DRAFT_1502637 [Imleria badia]
MVNLAQPKQQEEQALVPGDSCIDTVAPPPFEQSAGDPLVHETYTAPGGEDPPEFAPYDASYFISRAGDLISHDPHLNEDGEAFYRFLLSQAVAPPRMFLHCRGSHDETHTRFVRSRHGNRELTTEQYTEKVVDFDFKIDVGQHIIGGPTHWSVGDSAPAYRGRMFREVGIGGEKHKVKRAELDAAKAWEKERDSRGFPPWIGSDYAWREDQPHVMHNNSVLKSSWTLRQWADDYCSSRKSLKEFEYHKVVYGWNFDALKAATRSVIISTHYAGDLEVSFETSNSIISVRSHNHLSRALSNGWIKFLLIITFIYPFLWLFRRFHRRGGGIWRVCGGAYALKRIEQVTSTSPQEYAGDCNTCESPFLDAPPADNIRYSGRASGSTGLSQARSKVVGLREGAWFRQWEGPIRRAVLNRLQEREPLVAGDGGPTSPTILLDGY